MKIMKNFKLENVISSCCGGLLVAAAVASNFVPDGREIPSTATEMMLVIAKSYMVIYGLKMIYLSNNKELFGCKIYINDKEWGN